MELPAVHHPSVWPSGPARWLVPSLGHAIGLIIFLVLLMEPYRTRLVTSDGDACMHWRAGEQMLQSGAILRADGFSHTRAGAPIVPKEWLSQLYFAVAGRLDGLSGVGIAGALVLAVTYGLLQRQLVRGGADPLVATVVTLLAVWASASHWHARPHVFSLLLVVLWHQAIRRWDQDGRFTRLALTLAVLTLLWVNLHGGYLAGAIVLGAHAAGAVVEWLFPHETSQREQARQRFLRLVLTGLLCAVVSLANPSGWHLHAHNWALIRSEFFVNWLDEYASPNFHLPSSYGLLVWLGLEFVALAVIRPRLRAADALLILGWTYLALYAARNTPLLALVTAPILAPVFSRFVREQGGRRLRGWMERVGDLSANARGGPLILALAVWTVAIVDRPLPFPSDRWPVAAVEFIRQHPQEFPGRMFNLYGWGGYLLVALPGQPVFVDGRADFYGEQFVREYDEVDELRPAWRTVLDKYDVGWTLLPASHRLHQVLRWVEGWEQVHNDEVATVWRRKR